MQSQKKIMDAAPDGGWTGAVQRPARREGPGPGGRALAAVRTAARAARRHPRISMSCIAWIFGIFAAFVPAALTPATPAAAASYTAALDKAALLEPALRQARRKAAAADAAAAAEAGWGWRWSADQGKKERVRAARDAAAAAADRVRAIEAEMDGHVRAARSALGLWSEAGLDETRAAFRAAFRRGHVLGKRQTLWDGAARIIFGGGGRGGREDGHPLLLLVELVLVALINFSTSMLFATLGFVFGLPSLIRSYSPGLLSGLAFACVALLGAVSVVTGFLALLAGGGVAVVAGAAALAAPPGRLRDGGGGGDGRPRVAHLPAPPRPRASAERDGGGGGSSAARPHDE